MRLSVLLFVAVLCVGVEVRADAVSFTDGEYLLGDWVFEEYSIGAGGSSTVTRETTGGNAGAFLHIENELFAAPGYTGLASIAWRSGAIYDPSVFGAISSIDYSEDAIAFSGAQTVALMVRQDSKEYVYFLGDYSKSTWSTVAASGIAAADFRELDPSFTPYGVNVGSHPDFSATAAPLQFGYERGNGTGGSSGKTSECGIDNWSVTVHSVSAIPLPPAALMGLGLLASLGAFKRLRRRRT